LVVLAMRNSKEVKNLIGANVKFSEIGANCLLAQERRKLIIADEDHHEVKTN